MPGRHEQFIENMENNTDQADQLFSDILKQFRLMQRIWNRMDSHRFEEMIQGIHAKLDQMEVLVKGRLVSSSDEIDRSDCE